MCFSIRCCGRVEPSLTPAFNLTLPLHSYGHSPLLHPPLFPKSPGSRGRQRVGWGEMRGAGRRMRLQTFSPRSHHIDILTGRDDFLPRRHRHGMLLSMGTGQPPPWPPPPPPPTPNSNRVPDPSLSSAFNFLPPYTEAALRKGPLFCSRALWIGSAWKDSFGASRR